jgi:hypothetical protein
VSEPTSRYTCAYALDTLSSNKRTCHLASMTALEQVAAVQTRGSEREALRNHAWCIVSAQSPVVSTDGLLIQKCHPRTGPAMSGRVWS